MNYKKILKEIMEVDIDFLNKEDKDFILFAYNWHIEEKNDLSSLQKISILRVWEDLKK